MAYEQIINGNRVNTSELFPQVYHKDSGRNCLTLTELNQVEPMWREYTPEPEPPYIPQSLPRWKGLAILELRGLTAIVRSIVAAKNATDGIAQIKFDNALTFDRDDELLVYVAQAAEMTSAQIDQLFIDGDALK